MADMGDGNERPHIDYDALRHRFDRDASRSGLGVLSWHLVWCKNAADPFCSGECPRRHLASSALFAEGGQVILP
jgi:hypothetical protein